MITFVSILLLYSGGPCQRGGRPGSVYGRTIYRRPALWRTVTWGSVCWRTTMVRRTVLRWPSMIGWSVAWWTVAVVRGAHNRTSGPIIGITITISVRICIGPWIRVVVICARWRGVIHSTGITTGYIIPIGCAPCQRKHCGP